MGTWAVFFVNFLAFVFVAVISVAVVVVVVVAVVVVLCFVLPFQYCLFRHMACVTNHSIATPLCIIKDDLS